MKKSIQEISVTREEINAILDIDDDSEDSFDVSSAADVRHSAVEAKICCCKTCYSCGRCDVPFRP